MSLTEQEKSKIREEEQIRLGELKKETKKQTIKLFKIIGILIIAGIVVTILMFFIGSKVIGLPSSMEVSSPLR